MEDSLPHRQVKESPLSCVLENCVCVVAGVLCIVLFYCPNYERQS